MTESIRQSIAFAATSHRLPVDLVEAVVLVESSGRPYAFRPEGSYRWLWNVTTNRPFRALTPEEATSTRAPVDFPTLSDSRAAEWGGQRASWGLMQIMGAVARERGFVGPDFPELCDPVLGLEYGCRHLAHLLTWARGQETQALGAWNAGQSGWQSAQAVAYWNKVLKQRQVLYV